jgi:hypothetical protein
MFKRLIVCLIDARLRSLVSDLEDDKSVVYYTHEEMPRAYQFAGGNGRTRTSFYKDCDRGFDEYRSKC